ncbi:hypothetical protein B0H17DRAFT_1142006 [Mycena rosella]|uniref:Uncharacterized protein n=1 Tax=Mycena rosella TaxID=1033263 RepID=A0AAD7CY55_MYCRO|nr:hypothetical protein B0H17DRAFT_1142006 [Mycena rosella]
MPQTFWCDLGPSFFLIFSRGLDHTGTSGLPRQPSTTLRQPDQSMNDHKTTSCSVYLRMASAGHELHLFRSVRHPISSKGAALHLLECAGGVIFGGSYEAEKRAIAHRCIDMNCVGDFSPLRHQSERRRRTHGQSKQTIVLKLSYQLSDSMRVSFRELSSVNIAAAKSSPSVAVVNLYWDQHEPD